MHLGGLNKTWGSKRVGFLPFGTRRLPSHYCKLHKLLVSLGCSSRWLAAFFLSSSANCPLFHLWRFPGYFLSASFTQSPHKTSSLLLISPAFWAKPLSSFSSSLNPLSLGDYYFFKVNNMATSLCSILDLFHYFFVHPFHKYLIIL